MNKEIDDKYQKRENTTFKKNQTEIQNEKSQYLK